MCITNPLKISDFQGNLLHMLLFPQKHAFYFSILRIKEGLLHVQQPQQDGLFADNLRLRDHLRGMDWPLTWYEAPGDHNWFFWNDALTRAMEHFLG